MRKFYPAKSLIVLLIFSFVITELHAQRQAKRRVNKTYVCGFAAGYGESELKKIKVNASANSELGQITGIIKDKEGFAIPFPSVILKGTKIGVAGDENGNFLLIVPHDSTVVLTVSAVGYKATDHKVSFNISNIILNNITELDTTLVPTVFRCGNWTPVKEIQLEVNEDLLQDVVVVAPQTISCKRILKSYCTSTVTHLCGFETENRSDETVNSVSIYPNPVRSGSVLKVNWKGVSGKYQWQLTDMSGRRIIAGETIVSEKTGVISIPLPAVAAGSYLIAFADGKGNRYSKTFIIHH